MLFEKGIAPIF